MSIEVLLDKSENNVKIAKIAEREKCYEVAVSRYYYSIYQKVTYILKKYTLFTGPEDNEKSPHVYTDETFKEYVLTQGMRKGLAYDDLVDLSTLGKIKRLRIKADYSDETINDTEFEDEFKVVYNSFSEKLKILL